MAGAALIPEFCMKIYENWDIKNLQRNSLKVLFTGAPGRI
jgi:hypothetical protein